MSAANVTCIKQTRAKFDVGITFISEDEHEHANIEEPKSTFLDFLLPFKPQQI